VSERVSNDERAWLRGVGMRVRLGRVVLQESQQDVGVRARVSRVTVGSVERADHPASVLAYVRLACAIGVPLGELLDGAP
jgi:transcriptional regulator with XRE-family HTH domain